MNLKCSDHPSGRIFPFRLMMEKMMPASSLPSHLQIVLRRTSMIGKKDSGGGGGEGSRQRQSVRISG